MTKKEILYIVLGFYTLVLLWYSFGARSAGYEKGYQEGMLAGQTKGYSECMCEKSNWFYNIGRILKNEAIQHEAEQNIKRCKEWQDK